MRAGSIIAMVVAEGLLTVTVDGVELAPAPVLDRSLPPPELWSCREDKVLLDRASI